MSPGISLIVCTCPLLRTAPRTHTQECLEDHIEKSGFSSTCKTTLEDVIAERVADFRLDSGLQVRRAVLCCGALRYASGPVGFV